MGASPLKQRLTAAGSKSVPGVSPCSGVDRGSFQMPVGDAMEIYLSMLVVWPEGTSPGTGSTGRISLGKCSTIAAVGAGCDLLDCWKLLVVCQQGFVRERFELMWIFALYFEEGMSDAVKGNISSFRQGEWSAHMNSMVDPICAAF
ncbi:hypothetical protein MLD38_022013 [Melastoma candidum]|uniref:Uncharacterized protein n=1 Tax=Melastoma candidum TaxID=119954 RepID=A0ACB9QI30_9MYRT|nr:hypothetical protein MLD38_022013 [Melastoma candidum]